jgi:putative SOS response-associated peptidase YedK
MCGRVIQSSGPIRYAIVEGLDVHDSRVHNYPPHWNATPSQELLVIRRNHQTGEVLLDPLRWGLYSLLVPAPDRRPSIINLFKRFCQHGFKFRTSRRYKKTLTTSFK